MRVVQLIGMCCIALIATVAAGQSDSPNAIHPNSTLEGALGPGQARSYSFALERGDSALIVIRQMGVDVVVDVITPGGISDSFDSPTGRYGDEYVELEAAESGGYVIRVRPFDDKEPSGKYRLQFVSLRNASQTAEAIRSAREWLAVSSVAIPASGRVDQSTNLPPFDKWTGLRVLGLGEATHGSREFNDLRLSLTQRLIQQNGYRIVALEGSASRFQALAPYIRGDGPKSADVTKRIEVGWIGRRSQRELVEWVRAWNLQHPRDRVRIVGIDAQGNSDSRDILSRFLERSDYGDAVLDKWKEASAELTAADDQTFVFGDSGVSATTRQFLVEVNAIFDVDAPMLRARFGAEFAIAKEAAEILLEFADFNSNGKGAAINHSRDRYMANRILRSLEDAGPSSKAVYWAHNSHVVHPKGAGGTAGGFLRQTLGCDYRAIALAFGRGAFVAQIPNDPEDRLAVSTLPPAPKGSLEALITAPEGGNASLATWECPMDESKAPAWLRIPRRMHWVGGLYKPGADPAEAFRPFILPSDFDGIAYLPTVSADEMPTDRPLVPPRKR